MKIIELHVKNVKGIKAVDITPTTNIVELAGRGGAGKSSVLDAINLGLGGKDAAKTVTTPLRNGEESGFVSLDLGSLRVERTFTAAGTSRLAVKTVSEDGIEATVGKAQGTLDALRPVTLDPEGFMQLTAKQQREELLGLLNLGVDLDALAADRAKLFEARTEIGRQGKAIGDVPAIDDGLDRTEKSAGVVIQQIRDAEDSNRARQNHDDAERRALDDVALLEVNLARVQEQLAAAKEHAEKLARTPVNPYIDTGVLEATLMDLEETNARIRVNEAAKEKLKAKAALRSQYEDFTRQIEQLDQERDDALANADVPLEGLSLTDDGITYQGVPLGDVNSSHRIEVICHIIAALNPRLRVIQIRHGSLLDKEMFARVEKFAVDHDYQIWIEIVGEGSDDAILIEAGEIA